MCINKSECILYDKLKPYYNDIKHQYFLQNIEKMKTYPFDFCIEELKLIIELDGPHHFKDMPHHDSKVEDRQYVDFFKMFYALKNGYTIIRLYQEDTVLKTFDWLSILLENIKVYEKPILIYISKNLSVYDEYRQNFRLFIENNKQ
jgi:very-short-patch-repair endonuclease